jgi:hypothetical protein
LNAKVKKQGDSMIFLMMKSGACAARWPGAGMTGHTIAQPRERAEPAFSPSSPPTSSWQGFLSSSIQPSGMLALVRRAVTGQGVSADNRVQAPAGSRPYALADVQKELALTLEDCPDDVLRLRIEGWISSATSVTELWLLRCDIYQCVARACGQGEASRRINSLLPVFEGWIPDRQLVPV